MGYGDSQYGSSGSGSGTYLGVPNNYSVAKPGIRQGSYMGAGYGMGDSPMVDVQNRRGPIYTEMDVNNLYGKSRQQVIGIQQALYQMGYSTPTNGIYTESSADAFRNALSDANRNGESLQEMYLRVIGKDGNPFGGGGSGSGAGSSGPRTSVSKSVSLTSRAGAQAILTQQLATELGREPTPGEVSRFLKGLNKTERANPTVSTTVSSATSSNTTTKQSNVDPGAEGADFAKTAAPAERKDFKEFQYMNVVAQMLGG
jgi:hypothetical protein